MPRKINLNEEKEIMFLKGELIFHPLWSGQNQMKKVKCAANWAIEALV